MLSTWCVAADEILSAIWLLWVMSRMDWRHGITASLLLYFDSLYKLMIDQDTPLPHRQPMWIKDNY